MISLPKLILLVSSMVKKLIIALSRRQILWYVHHPKDKTSKAYFERLQHVKGLFGSIVTVTLIIEQAFILDRKNQG